MPDPHPATPARHPVRRSSTPPGTEAIDLTTSPGGAPTALPLGERPTVLARPRSRSGRPRIGWFVHDRPGPIARARAIVPRLQAEVTIFHRGVPVALEDVEQVRLPPPSGHAGIDAASPTPVLGPDLALELSRWAIEHTPDLIVIDGPPEVALLARCTGLPIVPVRRPELGDGPLLAAVEELAAAWLAPFPAVLESPTTPASVRERTVYAGLITRYEGRGMGRRAARRRLDLPENGRHVAVLIGQDGPHPSAPLLEQASATASSWTFSVLGPCTGAPTSSERLRCTGWTSEVFTHLRAADAIIATSSLSTVADAAAGGAPLAVVPSRFAGAHRFATALEEVGAAIVLDDWPGPITWPALLADLLDRSAKPLRALADGRTAKRAAHWIDAWALSPPADPSQQRAGRSDAPRLIDLAAAESLETSGVTPRRPPSPAGTPHPTAGASASSGADGAAQVGGPVPPFATAAEP